LVSFFTTEDTEVTELDRKGKGLVLSGPNPFFCSDLCTTKMPFLRRTRRFSTAPRNPQDVVAVVVVVAVAVAVAVAGVIPLVAAVRLRCVLCALCGEKR
jgi:hypothetical protein